MKKNDVILIVILLVIGAFVILLINVTKKEGSKVLVTVDGKEYATFQLKEDTDYTVDLGNGVWNTFVIKDGKVDMTDASCPDKICVNHKDIEYNNETIVCLPNKVVLQIINGKESETDAVAN
jgi:hypothetical protein